MLGEREHELLLGVAEDTEEALRATELTAVQMCAAGPTLDTGEGGSTRYQTVFLRFRRSTVRVPFWVAEL